MGQQTQSDKAKEAAAAEEAALIEHLETCGMIGDVLADKSKENTDTKACAALLGTILNMTVTESGTAKKDQSPDFVVGETFGLDEEDAVRQVRRAFKLRDRLKVMADTDNIQPIINGPDGPSRPDVIARRFIAEYLLPSSKGANRKQWTATMLANRERAKKLAAENAKSSAENAK